MNEIKRKINALFAQYEFEYRIAVVITIGFLFYIHYSGCN